MPYWQSSLEEAALAQTARASRKAVPERKKAQFEISAALFEELGERLVSKPEVALAELIKNAYDADASECVLTLTDDELSISDNGHGMTEAQFLGNWMVVSSQQKGKLRFSRRYRRSMAGSKGVGRFSARFLGHVVELTSIARDGQASARTKLVARFDWDEITRQGSVSKVQINYTIESLEKSEYEENPIGTTLRISRLRLETKSISVGKVKTDILRLTSPVTGLERPPFLDEFAAEATGDADPGFSVIFDDDEDDAQLPSTLQTDIVNAYVGRVRLEVTEQGQLSYQVFWRGKKKPIHKDSFPLSKLCEPYSVEKLRADDGEQQDARGLVANVATVQQLPLATALHSPIFIDLRFFPKRKGTFSALGVNGTRAQRWIREHASYSIVDNQFGMTSYAAGSDWLGIDASKATNERAWQSIFTPTFFPISPRDKKDPQRNPMLALARGTQLLGRVHIATRKRPSGGADDSDDWLQANMDRESLRDNGAYRTLWHICRFAAEILAHFDRKLRLDEEAEKEEERQRDAKSSLSSAIKEIRSSATIDPEHRQRIVEQLRDVQERFEESAQYERDSRFSLELMSMMGVIAGFMTHEFEKAMGSLSEAAHLMRSIATKDPRVATVADEIQQLEKNLAHYMDYMRLFVNKARRPKPQQFKANAQVSHVVDTLSSIAQAHAIHTDVAIEKSLPGPQMPLAAYHGIVANLLSNSLKALVPKISSEPRKIRLYAANEGAKHILVCSDNGIGIPEYVRARIWDPLYTTTGDRDDDNPLGSGLGLGLSVVKQVLKPLRGSIELLDNATPGFVTSFRVTLPLT